MPKAAKPGPGPAVFKQEISLQPTAEEKAPDEKLPDFWITINELTPEDWIRHEILLYRLRPKLAIQGLGGYVNKFQHPFGIDDVKQAYGGYDWRAILQKDSHVVKSVEFTIEAPPKPDAKREVSAEGLSSAAAAGAAGPSDLLGLLREELKQTREAFQQQISMLREELTRERAGPAATPATNAVVDVMKAGAEAAVSLVKNQLPAAGTAQTQTDQLTATVDLFTKIKNLLAPADPLGDLKRLKEVIEAVGAIRGEGGGGGGGKESLGLALVEKGPEIIDRIGTALGPIADRWVEAAKYRHATAIALQARRPIPAPAAGAPSAPGGPHFPAPGQIPSAPLETVPLGGTAAATVEPTTEVYTGAPSLEWVKMRVVYMFELGQVGEAIVDFLDGVDERLSASLKGQTPTEIAEFFRNDPLLAPAAKTNRFTETINEMAAYLAPEGEEPSAGGKTQ